MTAVLSVPSSGGCGVPGAGVYEAIEELYHFYSVVASTA